MKKYKFSPFDGGLRGMLILLIIFISTPIYAQFGHGILTEFTKIKLDSSEGLSSNDWYHSGTLIISTPTAANTAIQTNNLSEGEFGLWIDVNNFFGSGYLRNKNGYFNDGIHVGSTNITTESAFKLGVFTSTPTGVFSNSSFNTLYWTTFAEAIDTASISFNASVATPIICTADTDGVVSTTKFVIKKTIAYSDRGGAVTIKEFAANIVIWSINVEVTTQFNGSGTDLLDIGVTGTGTHWKDDLDVSSTGWTTSMDGNIPERQTGTIQVIAQYFDENTDATAGSLDIYVEYTIH